MSWYHWPIVIIPVAFVVWMAIYSHRYARSVADYLVAGRVAGRYVLSAAGLMDGLAVISIVAAVEANYKTGFAMGYWYNLTWPIGLFTGLFGYVTYRFRQTLFNFIGNAVKYAGPCTIRVSVVYEGGIFKTTVSDNGRGVSAEKTKLLMQPFVQADIKNRTEGSGLGLSICKRLVELANGTISFNTAPGKGFTIRTEVPVSVAPGENAKEGESAAAGPSSRFKLPERILVVDDSPVNRAVLRAMLTKLGVKYIELAVDGAAALERLQKDSSFDWMLSDMWMPVMDGPELAKRIRSDKRLANLRVCSVTADVEARAVYKEQGFDALLLKPVTIASLRELFSS